MNPPAPTCFLGRVRSFALFAADDPFAAPDPAATTPTADEILTAKVRDLRFPYVPVTGTPGSDPHFVYFISGILRCEAKELSTEAGGRSFVFGRVRDRGDLLLEFHDRHERSAEDRNNARTLPAPSADALSIRYAGFRIDIPMASLAAAVEDIARLLPLKRPDRFRSSEWRLPDFKARAALVRNLDFVLSRPDIAVAPLLGAEFDGDRVRDTDPVGTYGAIHTLGAFARYNRGRLGECEQCHGHLVASDGTFRFCPLCGHHAAAFVYTGGGNIFGRQAAHIRFGKSVREAVAHDPGVEPVPDATSRMLPGGLDPNSLAVVFHGRLRNAYAALAMDEIAEHEDGMPRPSSPFPAGMDATQAAALLRRAAPFVLARPDIAAAPMPEGVGSGDTLGEYARAVCPDLPVLPGKDRMLPDGIRPADLGNVFRGRLVDAYVRIALDTLDRLDSEADEAIREGRSFLASFRLRTANGTETEAVFCNISGWATLLDGDGRTLGGVRTAWDTATGLATTLRACLPATKRGQPSRDENDD